MPTCTNLPRQSVRLWNREIDPETTAWISISEPDMPETVVNNVELDKLANLKMSFWDITAPVPGIGLGEYFYPPSEKDAQRIVDFIEKNRGKDFLINCQAGISRSGAVCKFLQDCLGYQWVEGKDRARPNKLLVELMKDYFYA